MSGSHFLVAEVSLEATTGTKEFAATTTPAAIDRTTREIVGAPAAPSASGRTTTTGRRAGRMKLETKKTVTTATTTDSTENTIMATDVEDRLRPCRS